MKRTAASTSIGAIESVPAMSGAFRRVSVWVAIYEVFIGVTFKIDAGPCYTVVVEVTVHRRQPARRVSGLGRAIIVFTVIGQVEVATQDRVNDGAGNDDPCADSYDRQPPVPDQFPAGRLTDSEHSANVREVERFTLWGSEYHRYTSVGSVSARMIARHIAILRGGDLFVWRVYEMAKTPVWM